MLIFPLRKHHRHRRTKRSNERKIGRAVEALLGKRNVDRQRNNVIEQPLAWYTGKGYDRKGYDAAVKNACIAGRG